MKGTKYRILRAARLLFNERGISEVSQRTISDHIAISPGNLTYHFNKREEIIEALYVEIREEISSLLDFIEAKEPTLESILDLSKGMNKILFENRFFTADYLQIIRAHNFIKKDYVALTARRDALVSTILQFCVKDGLVRKEELPNEFDFLCKRIQLVNDYWILAVGTAKDDIMLKHTRVYAEIGLQMLYPYLTEKGKTQFNQLLNS